MLLWAAAARSFNRGRLSVCVRERPHIRGLGGLLWQSADFSGVDGARLRARSSRRRCCALSGASCRLAWGAGNVRRRAAVESLGTLSATVPPSGFFGESVSAAPSRVTPGVPQRSLLVACASMDSEIRSGETRYVPSATACFRACTLVERTSGAVSTRAARLLMDRATAERSAISAARAVRGPAPAEAVAMGVLVST